MALCPPAATPGCALHHPLVLTRVKWMLFNLIILDILSQLRLLNKQVRRVVRLTCFSYRFELSATLCRLRWLCLWRGGSLLGVLTKSGSMRTAEAKSKAWTIQVSFVETLE